MKNEPKRARNAKRTRDEKKQGKQAKDQGKGKANVRRNAARGDGIGPSTY